MSVWNRKHAALCRIKNSLARIEAALTRLPQEIVNMVNPLLQPILDAVTNGFAAINASLQNEVAEIQAKLQELLDKIAAGGNVTAADVQTVVDQVTSSSTAVAAAIDQETQTVKATEPPA